MEQLDESRRDEFKAYQMMKEHERRAYLKSLSEEERLKEEQRDQEIKQKHGNHPKINHPVRHAESLWHSHESAGLMLTLWFCSGERGPAEGGVAGDRQPGPRGLRPKDLL